MYDLNIMWTLYRFFCHFSCCEIFVLDLLAYFFKIYFINNSIIVTATESSISFRIAKIVRQWIKYKIIWLLGSKICFWRHYFTDIFLVTKHENLNEILLNVNSIYTDFSSLLKSSTITS